MATTCRVAADIGGTFTDLAFLADDGTLTTRKLPSTPANYADAVIAGIADLMDHLKLPLEDIREVLHGCTVATNAILEHKGAKTALLTTKGFRDVLEFKRIRVPRLYDPLYEKPEPLVPRQRRFEVEERIDVTGGVRTPLRIDDVYRAIERIREDDVDAVAVCLLHSYVNPTHEKRIGEILRHELPDRFVSLSIDVLPQIREYERTSTTVINAYVGPPVQEYLRSLLEQFAANGVTGKLLVMQSGGGVLGADMVIDTPAQIVECGPAAGVIGAAHVGGLSGYRNIIALDMGGTTAKASIIENGELIYSEEYEVGGGLSSSGALVKGGGYALKLPAIDISEVGAGGGSIVWLDRAGSIKVGPQSAGAVPGPACYGAGGEDPTVTDANVVLGYINPTALAAGTVPIRADLARSAVETRIAEPMGRGLLETAHGIHIVANANMMRAVKAVTTFRGRDPRDFALFAFGGSGGVHAVDLARVLQIKKVIVPPAAGVFSAVGLLFANLETNVCAAFLHQTADVPLDEAERLYEELENEVAGRMGYDRGDIGIQRLADVRYSGQAHELTLPLPDPPLDVAAVAELTRRFETEHEKRYGHRLTGDFPMETVNLRVVGTVVPEGARSIRRKALGAAVPESVREVYFGPEFNTLETPVIERTGLSAKPRQGPLIIEEYEGTTVVPPDCRAHLDASANVVIELGSRQ